MQSIPNELLKELRSVAPEFLRAVARAKRDKVYLMLCVSAFLGEPELLYTCLAHAHNEGVAVLLVPDNGKTPEGAVTLRSLASQR